METRSELLAAVAAAVPESETWQQAVRRLGAWRLAITAAPEPAPKHPARRTGRDQYEQFYTLTKSSAFEADREALRRDFNMSNGTRRAQLIAWAQQEIPTRKQALKLAQQAA